VVTCFVSSPLHPPLSSTLPAPPNTTPPAPILRNLAPETRSCVRRNTPSKPSPPRPAKFPPTPLESSFTARPVSVDSKPLTPILTPFFAPLTKNRGVSPLFFSWDSALDAHPLASPRRSRSTPILSGSHPEPTCAHTRKFSVGLVGQISSSPAKKYPISNAAVSGASEP
jgi:hypothetical protein